MKILCPQGIRLVSHHAAIIFVDIQTCSTGIRIRQRCVHIFVCVGCLGWDGMALTQRDFLVFPVCPTNSHCVVTDDCNCKVKATSCVFETENKLVLWNNCRSLADAYIICCLFLSGSRWL